MKIVLGYGLVLLGIIMIIISIMGLVKAFDVFYASSSDDRNFVYTLGSIVFPLLLTVLGRWIFRRGVEIKKRG